MRNGDGAADATAVSLRDVGFKYPGGGVQALSEVSLDLPRGIFVGIVGPSGCGKSTLLTLIAGLAKPTAGELAVNGADSRRHLVTLMFQKDTLLPWLTVAENVKLFYRIHPRARPKEEINAFVDELLELAHLGSFRNFYPYQLSGGMKRRAAFLAAVVPAPEILLLDEPFSSLDEPTRITIHQDAYRIARRLNMTVILVTHDLAEAVSLCDEVVILTARPGRVCARYRVDLGFERNMLELRKTPTFLHLYAKLWEDLSVQIRASREREKISGE